MNSKVEDGRDWFDTLKWTIVAVLISAGFVGNHFFSAEALSLRMLGWLFLSLVALGVASQTTKGGLFIDFSKEARIELRKVVWPTRQETVQTTMIVIVMVILASLLLWGLDTFLLWGVGVVTGQRG